MYIIIIIILCRAQLLRRSNNNIAAASASTDFLEKHHRRRHSRSVCHVLFVCVPRRLHYREKVTENKTVASSPTEYTGPNASSGGPTGVEIVVTWDETFRGETEWKKNPKWWHAWYGILESTRHTDGDDNEYYQSTAAYAPAWRENGGCGVGVDHDGGGGGSSARVGRVHRPYTARAKNRRRRYASTPSGHSYYLIASFSPAQRLWNGPVLADTDGAYTENHFGVRNANRGNTVIVVIVWCNDDKKNSQLIPIFDMTLYA